MKMQLFKFVSYTLSCVLMIVLLTNCKKDFTAQDLPTIETQDDTPSVLGHSKKCSSSEKMEALLEAHPEIRETRQRLETFTENFVRNYDGNLSIRAVVTIPVVIHIVYKTAAQNVSDAQIQSQMRVLNEDFRKLNSNAANVPSVFKPLAADVEINFCLAQQDPNGAATTGIVRKQTSKTSFNDDDSMMSGATGGSDIWDSKRYLNIYVCNVNDFLGYAYYPGAPANIDAVVLNYKAFGTMGTATVPYHLGKTAVHEVGHWLNLPHIWGDDEDTNNTCGGSDYVADTPNQSVSNSGKPTFPHISCGNTPNGDMFMNYMDYCDDDVQNIFTLGQKARMQALFAVGGPRRGLVTSNACNAPTTPVACSVPTNLSTSALAETTATLSWGAVSGATSYTVQHKPTSGTTWTTANSTSNSLNITGLTANTVYQFQVKTTCSSGVSAYSTATSFTTKTATTAGCTDNYESNNTSATAKMIPLNTAITAKIGTATDVDWFTITTTAAQPKLKISLTNLPADYDVYVYKNGTVVAYSQNEGTAAELLTYNATTAGTYQILVEAYYGDFNANNCYTLKAETGAANFRIDASLKDATSTKKKKAIGVSSL